MPKKREAIAQGIKPKKITFGDDGTAREAVESHVQNTPMEIDFPRGGGSSLTALEHRTLLVEARKEADAEMLAEPTSNKSASRKRLRNGKPKEATKKQEDAALRVEHLNYKRAEVDMHLLGRVAAIHASHVVVSLPHQLFGHIPLSQVTRQFTKLIEGVRITQSDAESENDDENAAGISELSDIFSVGQYVRVMITSTLPPGTHEMDGMFGKPRNEMERASRRLELSAIPNDINKGISSKDVVAGYVLPAAVKTVEDHGYVLDFGISKISGFLSFEDASKDLKGRKLRVGHLLEVHVKKVAENKRTCAVGANPETISHAMITELRAVETVTPGTLVRALVTSTSPSGINVQVLGVFKGTIDLLHLGRTDTSFEIGQKLTARILWTVPTTTPRQLGLSILPHIIAIGGPKASSGPSLEEAYPIGMILDHVKVIRVEVDKGLYVSITDSIFGFVHISEVSDEHVPTLSGGSGPWKVNTVHAARVMALFSLDGVIQLSLKQSVLEKKFFNTADVEIGRVIKCTVASLTDRGLFVSLSSNIQGVVWPNHYADITLKHPERRFKVGGQLKCRVLSVDPDRNRISLTAKKTLVDSSLPIITSISDAKPGMQVHAVIYKITGRTLLLEFFNNVKGAIPINEAFESDPKPLESTFNVGQVLKPTIISVDTESQRITASLHSKRADGPDKKLLDRLNIGDVVSGTVAELHSDNIVLNLTSGVRALLAFKSLASSKKTTIAAVRATVQPGDRVQDLVVVSKNEERPLVIVVAKPVKSTRTGPAGNLSFESISVGQHIPGLVIRHTPKGTVVRLGKQVVGLLHPTDTCDDFSHPNAFPAIDNVINTVAINVDQDSRQVKLSSRPSVLNPSTARDVVDPEINSLDQLKAGDTVRGFVKAVSDRGLFVSLSRALDARVQIKELFDEFVKDWKARFTVNQLVSGRILRIDHDKTQIEMTFRSGDISALGKSSSLSDFTRHQRVDCTVKKVEAYGVFLQIKGTQTSGLCHKTELVDEGGPSASDVLKSLQEGDSVRAVVLTVDIEKKRISFSIKPSNFFQEDLESGDESGGEEEEAESADEPDSDAAEFSESDDEIQVDSMPPVKYDVPKGQDPPPKLSLSGGLRWNPTEDASDNEPASDESEGDDAPARKKRKHRHEPQHDYTADLQHTAPQASTDFERLLLGSPNSSFLWIQYMSFQLQLSQIDKAREIGRRALKAINFREEQERLNVWTALMNLESAYGTKETLQLVFQEATRANDSKTIHLRPAAILDQGQKHEESEELFRRTCKKFGGSSKVWTLFGEHYFKRGQAPDARGLLQRSLLSLDKRKHLKTVSKFAQMEYKLGDPERGRIIFEGIIDTHKKRLDLLNVYVDMEASRSNIIAIRSIFERAMWNKLSRKKAKFLFKKWLELEKKLGDEHGVEIVKEKAIAWTQAASGDPTD